MKYKRQISTGNSSFGKLGENKDFYDEGISPFKIGTGAHV